MEPLDELDASPSTLWSVAALAVEATLTFYEGDRVIAAMQLLTAALTYESGLAGAAARVAIELYRRER